MNIAWNPYVPFLSLIWLRVMSARRIEGWTRLWSVELEG